MPELVHSKLPFDEQRRILRLLNDIYHLQKLTRAEVRTVYQALEEGRDALSRMLDKADGKNA
jgi:hypothetical protein